MELYKNKITNFFWIVLTFLSYLIFLNYTDILYILLSSYKIFISVLFTIIVSLSFILRKKSHCKISLNIFIFISFFLFTFLYIENFNYFFIIIFLTSINDIIAYLVGSYLKGPKIIPYISPNKTWSGTISSYVISLIILITFFDFNIFYNITLPITFFIGDIYFSRIKRMLNIKDYGKLIKGHGGLLDRLDSSFFSLCFSSLFFLYI